MFFSISRGDEGNVEFNFSGTLPSVEHKISTGLMRKGPVFAKAIFGTTGREKLEILDPLSGLTVSTLSAEI